MYGQTRLGPIIDIEGLPCASSPKRTSHTPCYLIQGQIDRSANIPCSLRFIRSPQRKHCQFFFAQAALENKNVTSSGNLPLRPGNADDCDWFLLMNPFLLLNPMPPRDFVNQRIAGKASIVEAAARYH